MDAVTLVVLAILQVAVGLVLRVVLGVCMLVANSLSSSHNEERLYPWLFGTLAGVSSVLAITPFVLWMAEKGGSSYLFAILFAISVVGATAFYREIPNAVAKIGRRIRERLATTRAV